MKAGTGISRSTFIAFPVFAVALACALGTIAALGDEQAGATNAGAYFLKPKDVVLFLGDSITRGGNPGVLTANWSKDAKRKSYWWYTYEDVKAKDPKLAESLTFVHAGFDAQRSTGGLKALTVELGKNKDGTPGPCLLEKFKPTMVVVCYGMNDAGTEPTMKQYEKAMQEIVKKSKEAGARVTLLSAPCKYPRQDKGEEEGGKSEQSFKNYIANLAKCLEIVKKIGADENVPVADCFTPLKKMMDEKKDWTKDGCHPTDEGHRIMADALQAGWGFDKLNAQK